MDQRGSIPSTPLLRSVRAAADVIRVPGARVLRVVLNPKDAASLFAADLAIGCQPSRLSFCMKLTSILRTSRTWAPS